MDTLALHLDAGSDVRQSLEALARQEGGQGFVLSVVGNLSQAVFQCPGKPEPTRLIGELEIITLSGTLSPEGVHLHLSFSDGDCRVWGGHLEPGTLVLRGADLLVGFLPLTNAAPEPPAASDPLLPAAPAASTSVVVAPAAPYAAYAASRQPRTASPAATTPTAAAPFATSPFASSPFATAPTTTLPTIAAPITSDPLPPQAAANVQGPRVEIAVLNGCPWSARALRLLRTLSIPHRLIVVDSDALNAEIQQRSGGTTLPQVFVDGVSIGGYDALVESHARRELEPLRQG